MTARAEGPEEFRQDLADVARLFYGDARILEEIVYRDQAFHCGALCAKIPDFGPGADALERKRLCKRALKLGLYDLLKQLTGIHPPWGSLTGIRPSRLYYEALAEGRDPVRTLVDTFDVAEDRAALLRELAEMQSGLRDMPKDRFDLYIGIPFCRTRCAYCSFSSGEIGNGKLVAPYVKALLREIERSAALAREVGLTLRAGYVGGGTPTAIPQAALEEILLAAGDAFPGGIEWTVEAGRPDSIDRGMLEMLKRAGATRISVNPQTFSDETLLRIGRAHTGAQAEEAFRLARAAGFDDINMDLIAGLPGEQLADFARTLARTLSLAPDSITVHALAIKRASKLHEAGHERPEGVAARMIERARDELRAAGFRAYYLYRQKYMADNLENVGYAKPGKACLYNIGNMEEVASVLALGAGAITKWLFDRQRRIERAPNVKNIEAYIDRVEEMVARKRALILGEGER